MISQGFLDHLVVASGPDVRRQALAGSAQQLRYGTVLEEQMDPAAESINWERIGIPQKAAPMMKLLWRQARALGSLANDGDGYQSMELEKIFLRAVSGPSRLNVAKPAARVSWWWTSRTILGRVGHMRTFTQGMDQYIFDVANSEAMSPTFITARYHLLK